ncbi:hypothetical protein H5410_058897 [Solanum commersonii]|uniref:Uncharacterized protein n=1 Tax=Solanum commersonii TaxID=4109 RepID=A0A9J5W0X0_SOLCO|nr:hypothetical protein H5410_058897 [Solanum commersonii]
MSNQIDRITVWRVDREKKGRIMINHSIGEILARGYSYTGIKELEAFDFSSIVQKCSNHDVSETHIDLVEAVLVVADDDDRQMKEEIVSRIVDEKDGNQIMGCQRDMAWVQGNQITL